jgi:hypothetical protein
MNLCGMQILHFFPNVNLFQFIHSKSYTPSNTFRPALASSIPSSSLPANPDRPVALACFKNDISTRVHAPLNAVQRFIDAFVEELGLLSRPEVEHIRQPLRSTILKHRFSHVYIALKVLPSNFFFCPLPISLPFSFGNFSDRPSVRRRYAMYLSSSSS